MFLRVFCVCVLVLVASCGSGFAGWRVRLEAAGGRRDHSHHHGRTHAAGILEVSRVW